MYYFFQNYREESDLIIAHRTLWLNGPGLRINSNDVKSYEGHIKSYNLNKDGRVRDNATSQRGEIALFKLIDHENKRAHALVRQYENKEQLSLSEGVLNKINAILEQSGVDLRISIDGSYVLAHKGTYTYSIDQMSDGEKNILTLCSQVLTSEPDSLILIDEPERHLHPRVSSSVLSHLFGLRNDIFFVISTHDIESVSRNNSASVIIVRDFLPMDAKNIPRWSLEEMQEPQIIDESIRTDILGSRQNILFIESEDNSSIDGRLYSLLFPNVTVIPKGNCTNVKSAVKSVRSLRSLHRLEVGGIVDKDSQTDDEIEANLANNIYSLPFYSIESIYFHPILLKVAIKHHVTTFGGNTEELLKQIEDAVLYAYESSKSILARKKAFILGKRDIQHLLPKEKDLSEETIVDFNVHFGNHLKSETQRIDEMIKEKNILSLIQNYSVKKTPGKSALIKALGYSSIDMYYDLVIRTIESDEQHRIQVKELIGNIPF